MSDNHNETATECGDEMYSLTAEQYAWLYWHIRSLDLPQPNVLYVTSIHPDANDE